jgi:hypothetical protein
MGHQKAMDEPARQQGYAPVMHWRRSSAAKVVPATDIRGNIRYPAKRARHNLDGDPVSSRGEEASHVEL